MRLKLPSVGMQLALGEITLLSSLPKLDEQPEQKNANLENVETVMNAVIVEIEETAEQEKKEAVKDPLRTISAGGATTTVTGLPHVPKGETEVGAVKETVTAKKAAALNVEVEAINNVIVEVVPSAVGVPDPMTSPEAVTVAAEEMREEVEEDLTVTAAAPKIATVAETVEIEEADLTHLTTATVEQKETIEIEEVARLREEARTAEEMRENITVTTVELVGLHLSTHNQDLILTLVRLASDHPPGLSKKKVDVRDAHPATATMKCIHLEADHAAIAEDANAAAQRNLATKEKTLRKSTSSSLNNLPEKNNLQESHRPTKIAPASERAPAHKHKEPLKSDGFLR